MLYGDIVGKGMNKIVYKIKHLVALPNLSNSANTHAELPSGWELTLEENIKLFNGSFLGFIHSHPGELSSKSRIDTSFALHLYEKHGPLLMGIIGKQNALRMYHVNDNKLVLVPGETTFFKLRLR